MKIYLLHNIGSKKYKSGRVNANYNPLEQILYTDKDDVLTFDGVYKNVYKYRKELYRRKVILFVMGNYVGKDNSFNIGMPLEKFCDWNEIMDMVINYNFGLGWHTWSHRDLTKLEASEIKKELTPPSFFNTKYFAYPYGKFDKLVLDWVKIIGYDIAYSVDKGNNFIYQIRREYLK